VSRVPVAAGNILEARSAGRMGLRIAAGGRRRSAALPVSERRLQFTQGNGGEEKGLSITLVSMTQCVCVCVCVCVSMCVYELRKNCSSNCLTFERQVRDEKNVINGRIRPTKGKKRANNWCVCVCVCVCPLTGGPGSLRSCAATLRPQTLSRYFQHLSCRASHRASKSVPTTRCSRSDGRKSAADTRMWSRGLNIWGEYKGF